MVVKCKCKECGGAFRLKVDTKKIVRKSKLTFTCAKCEFRELVKGNIRRGTIRC
jgi:Zn finger protein HypA/HybF involved in hydrogenase expression